MSGLAAATVSITLMGRRGEVMPRPR
ncbi:hypothetical protein PPSIR1_21654 [Plesiocystis pacifica SIR-1]|uniref:Uncharacterized protein n=1 Tax=Plesiocystis pacifica SIR-1 TaxID=391625 RepID=A6FXH8_9BACT|nr:hypothetical protein PPSIR1_21654 [Plesiocystis pacifica SIR-1]